MLSIAFTLEGTTPATFGALLAADRSYALGAMQRPKTLMLRHSLQVDDVQMTQ